jgi:hypothetical protein
MFAGFSNGTLNDPSVRDDMQIVRVTLDVKVTSTSLVDFTVATYTIHFRDYHA